ncbi:MAG TPA: tetratricopeptide repeat protein [Candidatus Dormibacteraeota bacterium]|nr:tetratricopeptide repeat protein [Candidatus Dormibacteraeota bacterium]
MNTALRAAVLLAICAPLGAGAHYANAAQNSGVTRTRIHRDAAAAELNRLLNDAQTAVQQKDFDTAAKDYQQFLAKKPDDAIVHFDLGYVYTALNRADDAKSQYQKAVALDPKMGAAYLNLGLTLLQSSPADAVDPLQHAADLLPDQPRPRFLLATALERSGKLNDAIAQYQAAEKLDAKDFETHLALGLALLHTNRLPDAEREFRAALVLQSDSPEADEAHLGLGQCLIAQKQYQPGIAELGAYLNDHPKDAHIRVERAAALVDLGQLDQAMAELDRAASQGPENTDALELRARIYFAKKQFANAVPPLKQAVSLAPQNANFRALLGHALLASKDYSGAVAQLLQANKLDPSANDVLGDLVIAEYNTQNYAVSLQVLDVLSKRSQLPPESWFLRGACYDKLNAPEQALDAYKHFLQLNTDENSDMYFEASSRVRALTLELKNKKR